MAGEVVFLCGAGVSAPQLHGFQKLVDLTFERLNVEMSTSEANAYNGGRFEEVLGSLERRLAEAGRMVRAVSDLLSVPDEPELDHHATLLRLSRDLENRILIVTTNFDTLLERASSAVAPDPVPAKISFAGQSLPAPSSAEFSGIIHLHGRLADDPLDLTATPWCSPVRNMAMPICDQDGLRASSLISLDARPLCSSATVPMTRPCAISSMFLRLIAHGSPVSTRSMPSIVS
jgi:hypothetical protein